MIPLRLLFIALLVVFACEDKQEKDCAGVEGGTAILDSCDECVDGNTGKIACTEDCNNEWGGTAVMDSCGTCDSDASNDCGQDCSGEWGGNNICGCTDSTATNYDSNATFDDSSCLYSMACPPSMHWEDCGSACAPSCMFPLGLPMDALCITVCVTGCVCNGLYDELTGQCVSSWEECSNYINCNNEYSECLTDCCNQFSITEDNCDESIENWEEGNNTAPEECFDACLLEYNACTYCTLYPHTDGCGW